MQGHMFPLPTFGDFLWSESERENNTGESERDRGDGGGKTREKAHT